MSDVTSSAGSTVDASTNSMLTSFTIESMDVAKVYIRNTGQNALTSLSIYVNDEPATYNVTTPIAAGSVGTVTIYSFIPDGAIVKVTSPNGFSASKVATPCSKAVGCWNLDEGTGTTVYDSSPNGNSGTVSGALWTSSRYGSALRFDGSNDYVSVPQRSLFSFDEFTISFLMSSNLFDASYRDIIGGYNGGGFLIAVEPAFNHIGLWTDNGITNFYLGSTAMNTGRTYFVTCLRKKGSY